MPKEIEAVYENGVLRPLEALPLTEHQHVKVWVAEMPGDPLASMVDQAFLERARTEVAAAGYIPTIEDVRRMTAKDPNSWAAAVIAEREERV
jgi:predicted DNA-binding antitoxin AbrB/MazE fold protein